MSKNKKVMSVAIQPELQDECKTNAKRRGVSVSAYIGNLVEQAVKLNPDEDLMVINKPNDEDIVPVILRVPKSLRGNPEKLQQWMEIQSAAIIKAMSKPPEVLLA
jgi:hypothetical protein